MARKGIFGQRANALLEDLEDHILEKVERLKESERESRDFRLLVCRSLGDPEFLASTSAIQLSKSTWQGRNPWISALVFSFVIVAVSFSIMGGVGSFLARNETVGQLSMFSNIIELINWLPLFSGICWLVWHAYRMPAGWVGFAAAVAYSGILFPCMFFEFLASNSSVDQAHFSFGIGLISNLAIAKSGMIFSAAIFYWQFARFARTKIASKSTLYNDEQSSSN